MSTWYVGYVAPGKEFEVVRELIEIGVDAYCPTRKTRRRPRRMKLRKGRERIVTVPLFSGYVFTTYLQRHKSLIGYVRMGKDYAHIPEAIITLLKRDVERGIHDDKLARDKFQIGEKIDIAEGPFAGRFAEFIRSTGDDLFVEVWESGKTLHVRLPWFQVRKRVSG